MTQRALIIATALILVCSIFSGYVYVDHVSCTRTSVTRQGLRIFFTAQQQRASVRAGLDHGESRALDLQAADAAREAVLVEYVTSCSGVFP